MFIHIWVHWFWITAAHFKGFLFFTAHTVSFHPHFAEAGLLDNETFTPPAPHPYNDSSQPPRPDAPNITSPFPLPPDITRAPPFPSSSSSPSPPSAPREDFATEEPPTTARTPLPPTRDIVDTYNGGTMGGYNVQFPLKKSTKYAKYGKARTKGKEDKGDKDGEEDASTDAMTTVAADPEKSLQHEGNETRAADDADVEILKNETLVIESKVEEGGVYTTVETFSPKNRMAAATSAHNFEADESDLNAASITGITLGILVIFSLFGTVSFVLYRRRYLNKPEVLHDKCSNLDSSGYIDETSLRENSEEMYSLDNDSFLNSLEAMTIQNYWTESVKHTKL